MSITRALNAKKTEAREYQTPASGIFFTVKEVLYEGRSKFQRIEIIRNKDYGRVLLLDGLVQTTERDEFYYHEMLVHPALTSHARPKNVLIIGGGDGGALREVLKHPVEEGLAGRDRRQGHRGLPGPFPLAEVDLPRSAGRARGRRRQRLHRQGPGDLRRHPGRFVRPRRAVDRPPPGGVLPEAQVEAQPRRHHRRPGRLADAPPGFARPQERLS